jgi:hypothetical protein
MSKVIVAEVVPIKKAPGDDWAASIPAELTARQALVFVEKALADAAAAEKEILGRYSGTLPPPPWPKHPELEKAIDAMEGGRLMLNQAITLGFGDKKEKKDGPTGKRLLNGGRALYSEVAKMQENLKGISAAELPGMVISAAKKAAETQLGGLLTIGLVLWALHEFNQGGGDD